MTDPQAGNPEPPSSPAATDDVPSLLMSADAVVPDWLGNLAALGWRVLAIAALVVGAFLVANQLFVVTASIAVAVVISAFFAPYALRLRERGHSRAVSAAIVWAAALAIVALAVFLLALALVPHLIEIVSTITTAIEAIRTDVA